jgi:hypothetical protein
MAVIGGDSRTSVTGERPIRLMAWLARFMCYGQGALGPFLCLATRESLVEMRWGATEIPGGLITPAHTEHR